MPILTTPFGPVGYTDTGDGPALVFVHGFLFDRTMWTPQVDYFTAHGYRVLCLDMVGFGASAGATGIIPMAAHSRALAALVDACAVEPAVLVGYSMGGQVVMDFLHRHPARARAAVFSDTFAGLDSPESRMARMTLADRLEREGVEEYAEEFLPWVLSERTVRDRPEVTAKARAMILAADPVTAASALRGRAERADYTDVVRTLSIPALVVAGAQDRFDRGVLAAELRAALPNGRMTILDETGHTPSMEDSDLFNRTVHGFLRAFTT
ncbi:alpha/beta fold hydrolase [Nocardia panacis]|uniref:Alpha/beta fold hydrolase n=1 Tax=Nocardia panacis TaxID=2340916 RepID=A0A3A4KVA6_9NOCA|nr:alpha/beta fold hydrolase [Nocardia panacis]RJO79180.1 alpha/beta fold hydrolase [Nocardia panacis]